MYTVVLCNVVSCCFFFQAEDGIRDTSVTGVQTCALPICWRLAEARVIAPILEPLQAANQQRHNRTRSNIADDSAHSLVTPKRSCLSNLFSRLYGALREHTATP